MWQLGEMEGRRSEKGPIYFTIRIMRDSTDQVPTTCHHIRVKKYTISFNFISNTHPGLRNWKRLSEVCCVRHFFSLLYILNWSYIYLSVAGQSGLVTWDHSGHPLWILPENTALRLRRSIQNVLLWIVTFFKAWDKLKFHSSGIVSKPLCLLTWDVLRPGRPLLPSSPSWSSQRGSWSYFCRKI